MKAACESYKVEFLFNVAQFYDDHQLCKLIENAIESFNMLRLSILKFNSFQKASPVTCHFVKFVSLIFSSLFLFRAAMFINVLKEVWKNEKKGVIVLNVESKSFGRKWIASLWLSSFHRRDWSFDAWAWE